MSSPSTKEWANSVHFSTGKDDWATPDEVFLPLHNEFRFTLDAAASRDNHRIYYWLGPGSCYSDALAMEDWGVFKSGPQHIWLNPPYSRGLQGKFIKAAWEQSQIHGHVVVMLIPARTDTVAFHGFIWDRNKHRPHPGVQVRFLKGRIKFGGAKHGAPFPSMVVVFDRRLKAE